MEVQRSPKDFELRNLTPARAVEETFVVSAVQPLHLAAAGSAGSIHHAPVQHSDSK